MKIFSTAVFLSLVSTCVDAIYGGVSIQSGNGEVMVTMRGQGNENLCGGTIIGSSHVITTTSCAKKQIKDVVVNGTSSVDVSPGASVYKIKSISIHPDYSPGSGKFDLAILQLDGQSQVSVARLPTTDALSQFGSVYGWDSSESPSSVNLLTVSLPIVPIGQCKLDTGKNDLDETFICAGGEAGKGVALLDAGGPLTTIGPQGIRVNVLLGVLSEPRGLGKVSIFVRVNTAMKFIEDVFKQHGDTFQTCC